jgi:gluconokinase
LVKIHPDSLHPLSDGPAVIGGDLGAQYPELGGVPWFPAIGDGAASNLGSGATEPGFAAINVGTSAALRVMRNSGRAQAPFGLFCYRLDANRYLVGGPVSNAGNLRSWCLRELKLPAETLDDLLATRPGPAAGLTVFPAWTAERAPTWDEEQTGFIHGITQHTTALDLFQAITDATYHRLARIAEMLLAREKRIPKFIVSGGIQNSPHALQRFADIFGYALHPNDEPEASIRGAAIRALEILGMKMPRLPVGRAVKPRMRWHRKHTHVRARLLTLEETLASCDL